MKQFPIALQLYSVRQQLEEDFLGTLKSVKEMGYDGVELVGLYGYSADTLKEILRDIGLTPLAVHADFQEMLTNPQVIDAYRDLGCKYVVFSYPAGDFQPETDAFKQMLCSVRSLVKEVRNKGMKLCYHNHDFEFCKSGDDYGLDILYREVPGIMAELDSCWIKAAGESPIKYIQTYADRMDLLHIKDFGAPVSGKCMDRPTSRFPFEFRPVGYGVQDWPAILQTADTADVSWIIVEQDYPALNVSAPECARMSIQYLRTLL